MNTVKTPAQIARMYGCTEQQAAALLKKNADVLQAMANKAAQKRGKYNGYTQVELQNRAQDYLAASGAV